MRDRLLTIAMVAFSLACNKDHSLGQMDEDAGADAPNADSVAASAGDTAAPTQADLASAVGPETQPDSQPSQTNPDTQSSSMAEEVAVSPPVQTDAQPAGTATETFASDMDALVGSWTGYVENYQFDSGSDVIKLVLSVDAGRLGGKVTYGVGTPPPPATDPNTGYPTSVFEFGRPYYWEGFAYSIVAGTYGSHRLRFNVDSLELWSGWCALQPAPTDGSTTCLPQSSSVTVGQDNCSFTKLDGTTVPVDCGKIALCFGMMPGAGVCNCSPAGCVAGSPYNPDGDTAFDVFIAAGTASGSVSGSFGDHNVHFVKD
jgi:hypothetical protein